MAGSAVIFDLDDTLIVEQSFAMASLREALGVFPGVDPVADEATALEAIRRVWWSGADHGLCLELGLASWEGLWSEFDGNHPSLDGLRAWAPTYREEAWTAVADVFGVVDTDLPAVAAGRFVDAQRRGHPPVPGAVAAVDLVATRHRVGLLTNGSSDLQRRKLDQAGLSDRFGVVAVSGETATGKPDPAAFTAVLERLGAGAEDSVMVGDSWERDVVGALVAGMSACWVSAGRPVPEVHPRVTVIGSVAELERLMA